MLAASSYSSYQILLSNFTDSFVSVSAIVFRVVYYYFTFCTFLFAYLSCCISPLLMQSILMIKTFINTIVSKQFGKELMELPRWSITAVLDAATEPAVFMVTIIIVERRHDVLCVGAGLFIAL